MPQHPARSEWLSWLTKLNLYKTYLSDYVQYELLVSIFLIILVNNLLFNNGITEK